MREPIIPGPEPSPKRNFVNLFVAFDLRRATGKVTREKGEVLEQKWLGFTQRGQIPEFELKVRGKTGTCVLVRLTEDHALPI